MEFLKTGTYGGLFQVTFTISATFQAACVLLGSVVAVLSPSSFTTNGVKAANSGQAIVSLIIMLIVMMLLNLIISAAGSGLWMLVRRFVFKPQPVEQVFS